MAIPVTFTVRPADGGVQVTVQFGIATEAGQRLDRQGRPVKPHFLEEVVVRHNERTVLTAYLGPAMARSPEVSFVLPKVRAGDALVVAAKDNRGNVVTAEHRIA